MSFDYNYKFWVATEKELEDVMKRQDVLRELKPVSEQPMQHLLFAELYARYVQLVNKLGYVYHHSFQVQKRDVIKNLVQAATQRLLELKNELKNLEFCEFIYIDQILVKRRLTPDDIVVWTPKYFPYWRPLNIHELIHGPRKPILDEPQSAKKRSSTKQKSGAEAQAGPEPASQTGDGGASKTTSTHTTVSKRASMAKARQSDANITMMKFKKNLQQQEEIPMDPAKKQLMNSARLIQSHERARVARAFLKRIRRDPEHYRPKIREDGTMVKYKFTHKPNQTMLIPIKRTRFEANYYVTRKDFRSFNYYVKPVFFEETKLPGDLSDLEESDLGEEEVAEEFGQIEEEASEGSDMSEYETESFTQLALEEMVKKMLNSAATKIQNYWRAHRDRKNYQTMLEQKEQIYGMADKFRPVEIRRQAMYEERMKESMKNRLLKENYDEELIKFCDDERARILRVRGPWIMEDISDGIRAWFKEFYDKLEAFHPYPDEVKGGTLLLLKGETLDVFEYGSKMKQPKPSKEELKKIKEKEKEKRAKEREKMKKAKKAAAKRRAKLKKAGIIDFKDEMSLSKPIQLIEETMAKYKKEWADINEKLNEKHEIIKEWITSDYFAEIHQELQLTVDEMMRLEYELLQRALAKDKKQKYKPPKNKKPKKPKKKKGKKKPHDPTADRSVESLYYELQDRGIAKIFPRKTFDYFIGDRNLCAYDLLNIQWKDTPPFKGEIKDILQEYVLGMGPLDITKPKAICLVGPTHSGKMLLCHILATEIDAVVLDISPENIVTYQDNLKYFCQLIVKMANLLQPTILFIRDVHRVFWKKVPPEAEEYQPKFLQKALKKQILKPIKKFDKIFLLGTTDSPWSATGKMKSLFQKILLVPKTEYATSFILRRNLTLQNFGIPRNFYFSPLALVMRDYNTGDLVNNINSTLNLKRKMTLVERPLQHMEFLDNMLNKEPPQFPPEQKEWDKFKKWYKKVSKLEKKRAKLWKARQLILDKQKEKQKKKKG